MTTVVYHRHRQPIDEASGDYVFIGRPSKWGNPHPVGVRCPKCHYTHSQEQAVEYFSRWWNLPEQASLRADALLELKDKVLGCPGPSCTPDRCHGKIIADYVNAHA